MCSCQLVVKDINCFFVNKLRLTYNFLKLERLAQTRWCHWCCSVSKVKLRIEIIVNVPGALSLQNIDRLAIAEVQGLLLGIRSMSFLRSLLVAGKLLGTVNSV